MTQSLGHWYLKRIALGLATGLLSHALRGTGADAIAAISLGVVALLVGTVLACWSEAHS